MSNRRQFRISVFSNLNDAWKVRPIYGFEKQLFPNTPIKSTQKSKRTTNIDPARFIYPRDAMGNMLIQLSNRSTPTLRSFYLPKYDFTKTHSPVWTIKNVRDSKGPIHHVGPMKYDSVNDKSQLPCRSGWTQLGRQAFNMHSGLTIPFYDTRKYKQVGDPSSQHAAIIGRRTTHREIRPKKIPDVIKRKSASS